MNTPIIGYVVRYIPEQNGRGGFGFFYSPTVKAAIFFRNNALAGGERGIAAGDQIGAYIHQQDKESDWEATNMWFVRGSTVARTDTPHLPIIPLDIVAALYRRPQQVVSILAGLATPYISLTDGIKLTIPQIIQLNSEIGRRGQLPRWLPELGPAPIALSREMGQLINYDADRGFGFIKPLGEKDNLFVHTTAAATPLGIGQWLLFTRQPDRRRPTQLRATQVRSIAQEAEVWQNGHTNPPSTAIPKLLELWLQSRSEYFNLHLFQNIFLTLSAADQLFFLRKVSGEILNGQRQVSLIELQGLVRYNRSDSISTGGKLDYTIDLVLHTLSILLTNGTYPNANTLTEVLFRYLGEDITELPRLNAELFSACLGRTVQIRERDKSNDKLSGEVDGVMYQGVADKTGLVLEEGRILPVEDETVVWIDGQHKPVQWTLEEAYTYKWNRMPKPPMGIRFCEGRMMSNTDSYSGKNQWWCRNQRCYAACQSALTTKKWEYFTLADFIQAFKLPFDEASYYAFIGMLNRLEQLAEHLNCRGCQRILRPVKQSNFSLYRANQFKCTNEECEEQGRHIYLSTCSNGKCVAVIDGRDSIRCNYANQGYPDIEGLYICKYCGSCCSKKQHEYRRDNLRQTHSDAELQVMPAFNRTKWYLEKELYHLEKGEVFCYQCGRPVKTRYGGFGNYVCESCRVEYKYDLVAKHKQL